MPEPNREWTEKHVEQQMGTLLRAGVMLAAAVVASGGVIYLLHHGAEIENRRVFEGEPNELRSPHGILLDAARLRGRGLIQLGLLLLVATPVARVIFSVFAFARERDYLYVIATLVVLGLLLFSLLSPQ